MTSRILYAIKRRPVRVAEAVLALAAALGIGLTESAEAQVLAIVVALVGLIGAEVAQTQTTSKRYPQLDHQVPDGVAQPAPASDEVV